MARVKLAQLLARRKELLSRVETYRPVDQTLLTQTVNKRIKVQDNFQETVIDPVPKTTVGAVTEEYDFYQRQLRLVDSTIQEANWASLAMQPKGATDPFVTGPEPKVSPAEKTTLGRLLLVRKELNEKVVQMKGFNELVRKNKQFQTPNLTRRNVGGQGDGANHDDVSGTVPTINAAEVQNALNFYSQRLRMVDDVIQHANWNVDLEVADSVVADFVKK